MFCFSYHCNSLIFLFSANWIATQNPQDQINYTFHPLFLILLHGYFVCICFHNASNNIHAHTQMQSVIAHHWPSKSGIILYIIHNYYFISSHLISPGNPLQLTGVLHTTLLQLHNITFYFPRKRYSDKHTYSLRYLYF